MLKDLFRFRLLAIVLLTSGLLSGISVKAQTTITTTFANNNGSGLATFNFKNNGTGPVQITEIGSVCGASSTQTVTAWYKPTAISGPPGAISTGNGWTQFGSGTIMGIANTTTSTAQIFFPTSSSTLTPLVIPPGATFGIVVSATSLRYSTLSPGVFTETAGSCSIITGDLVGYGGAVPPAAPTNYPRGFIGYVKFIEMTPCTGTPAATLTTTVTSVCAGIPFSLSAGPTGSGLTYLYQYSTDGGTVWNNLAPATGSSSYNIASQTVATSYRVIVTCDAGGTDTSTVVAVGQNPPSSCYCTPVYTYDCSSGDLLDGFTLVGEGSSINHTGTGCTPGGYADYTSMSVNLFQGFNYPGTITTTYTGTYEDYRIWIDFNDNGLFESSESLAFGTGIGSSAPGTFTLNIPPTAPIGPHRMRARLVYSSGGASSIDPCASASYGEAHDYTVNIIAPSACTGTPSAGITSSVTTICAGIPFMLTATPNGMTGYTYQFQKNEGTGWVALGSSSPSFTYSVPTITGTTQYRVIVTCSGGGSNTSSAITVTQSPGSSCYCTPVYTYDCSSGDLLDGFTLVGEGSSINHTGTGCSPGGYADYTSMSVNLFQGFNYPGTITTTYSGTYEDYRIWIDFNDNGAFEASESLAFGTGIGSSSPGTFTLNIPPTAPTGPHRMRARLVYSSGDASSIDPCAMAAFGEAHDYTVNIIAPAACTGTPSAGITSSATTACVGVPFILTATPNGMTGYTYQFQKNDGSGWEALGSSSALYTYTVPSQSVTTQYRVIVTCSGGGSNTSSAITVTQNPATSCYCTPTTTGGTSYYISNFTTTGATLNINKTSTGSATGYQDFHLTDSAKAMPGATINYSMTVAGGSTYGRAIWIDLNEDGVFQISEQLVTSTTYMTSPLSGNFTIPMTTTPGVKRMRIIASFTPANPSDPCMNSGSGEYEDYNFVVAPLPPCAGMPVAGTAGSSPAMICSGGAAGLTLSGFSTGVSGIAIQWESSGSITGPFSPITGATSTSYSATGITAATYFRAKVTCTNSSLSAYSDTVTVAISNPVITDSLPGSSCSPGPITISATPGAGSVVEWYDAPTGGTLLATGNTYTTPSLSTTTTYYAQAVAVVADDSVGLVNSAEAYYMNAPAFMTFNAYTDFTLQSVKVYPYNNTGSPTGTITISVEDVGGAIIGTATQTVTGTLVPTTPVVMPLNFEIPAGNGYKLNISSTGIDGYLIDESPTYPYVLPGVVSIIDGYVDAGDVFFWGAYNWRIKASCTGPRVPVTATIGGVPVIVDEPLGDTTCVGQTLTLHVNATGAASYQWYGPLGEILGATSATYTIPSVGLADGGDYSVAVNGPVGCGSATSGIAHVVIGSDGQWMGFSADWNDGNNWCGGLPTATTDALIPGSTTVPFEPVISLGGIGEVRNISIMSSTVTVNGLLRIYGDASATAGGALDLANGDLTLAGAVPQSIGIGFNVKNLVVTAGSEKSLGNDVIVTNAMGLLDGILNLGTNTLTMWPGSTISGGSANTYVKTGVMGGLKQEVGATAVTYPVGRSAYNPVTITNTGELDNITIRVRDEVLTSGYSGTPVVAPTYVVKRTWDIEEEEAGGSNATVNLQWNAGEENSTLFDYSHVYIAHYMDGDWQNTCCTLANMAPAAAGSGPYTVSQSGITSFSPFTVASAGGDPLHVSTVSGQNFKLTAYPNPVSEVLTVKVEGGKEKAQVSLTDVTGRELMAHFVENGKVTFRMQGLSDGVYFVKYSDGTRVQTVKVNKL